MRILILAMGSAGDVHPFIGVGRELTARGHEVLLFSNEFFRLAVEANGLTFVALGTAELLLETEANPDLWHPRKGLDLVMNQIVFPTAADVVRVVSDHVVEGETLIIGSSLAYGGLIVEDLGIAPMITVHLAPTAFLSVHRPPVLPGIRVTERSPDWYKRGLAWVLTRVTDLMIARPYNQVRAGFGLPPVSDLMRGSWNAKGGVIGLFPSWFAPPQPDWPPGVVLTGFPLFDERQNRPISEALSGWLDDGDPPIVITPGSANVHGHRFIGAAMSACGELGRRALILTKGTSSVPDPLPRFARHDVYAPFSQVFPRSAAVCSHGGIGTIAQGLAAGVPQLIGPLAFDQFDNASRLEDLGVGVGLVPRKFKPQRIRAALEGLLGDPAVRAKCEAARDQSAADPGVVSTCMEIEATGRALATSRV